MIKEVFEGLDLVSSGVGMDAGLLSRRNKEVTGSEARRFQEVPAAATLHRVPAQARAPRACVSEMPPGLTLSLLPSIPVTLWG